MCSTLPSFDKALLQMLCIIIIIIFIIIITIRPRKKNVVLPSAPGRKINEISDRHFFSNYDCLNYRTFTCYPVYTNVYFSYFLCLLNAKHASCASHRSTFNPNTHTHKKKKNTTNMHIHGLSQTTETH